MNVLPSGIEQGNTLQPHRNGGRASNVDVAPAAASVPVQTPESVRQAVAAINRAAKSLHNSVQLSLDAQSGKPIVRVVDTESGQLIRQIPTEEVLELSRALDRIAGLLIHQTA